jgi:hypothetical protein
MRRPPEEDVLRDGQLGGSHRALRDERHQPRELAAAERADVATVDGRGALERQEAAERAQDARLPRAVRPDEHHPLVRLDLEREAAHRFRAPEADGEVAQLDHRIVLAERSTTAKNGAPQNAVTTPIGSSAGDTIVRASTSASTRNPAPTTSDSGTTAR